MSKFITIEGPDGSGKSTLVQKIKQWLENEGRDFILTKEPGSPLNDDCVKMRQMLLDPDKDLDKEAELYLMMADRCNHVHKVIKPNLKQGKIVISDRYIDSSYAYQGWGRRFGKEEDLKFINSLNNHSTSGLIPHATIIVLVDPETGLKRASIKKEFGKKDRFEKEKSDFHKRVTQGYEDIIKNQSNLRNLFLIDTTHKDPEQTFQEVKNYLINVLD